MFDVVTESVTKYTEKKRRKQEMKYCLERSDIYIHYKNKINKYEI